MTRPQFSIRSEWISVKIGTLVGHMIRRIPPWLSRRNSSDSKLKRQFKVKMWQHKNVMCHIYTTANHTTVCTSWCIYSSALRGCLCVNGPLSIWWEILYPRCVIFNREVRTTARWYFFTYLKYESRRNVVMPAVRARCPIPWASQVSNASWTSRFIDPMQGWRSPCW